MFGMIFVLVDPGAAPGTSSWSNLFDFLAVFGVKLAK